MTEKQLNEWFNSLDSNQLMWLFPGLFEEIMMSADPERCDVNAFIDEADDEWEAKTYEQKLKLYDEEMVCNDFSYFICTL